MANLFRKAERKKTFLKIGISAPSGAGKTYSSLKIAYGITNDWSKIAVIDTENGSADLYSDLGDYSVCEITPPFTPQKYIDAINSAVEYGFEVLIIDSLTHAWTGEGGLLDIQDKATKASKSGNSYNAWREVTPLHNKLVDTILQAKCDVIITTRAKAEYVITEDNGKKSYKKIGLAPIFRDGLEYEMTVFFDMTQEHIASSSKDRTGLFDGKNFVPSEETGKQLSEWRNSGKTYKCSVCGKNIEFKLYDQTLKAYGFPLCSAECKMIALESKEEGGNENE
ncbi:MAG: AAA family ATPase [Clostridia bacterium]|nr:AAA family ATPase [Clostridia bacterium]